MGTIKCIRNWFKKNTRDTAAWLIHCPLTITHLMVPIALPWRLVKKNSYKIQTLWMVASVFVYLWKELFRIEKSYQSDALVNICTLICDIFVQHFEYDGINLYASWWHSSKIISSLQHFWLSFSVLLFHTWSRKKNNKRLYFCLVILQFVWITFDFQLISLFPRYPKWNISLNPGSNFLWKVSEKLLELYWKFYTLYSLNHREQNIKPCQII